MEVINKDRIKSMNKRKRANLITTCSGIKQAHLVGTISGEKISNLAIFSSIVHLGSNPPLIGIVIRPQNKRPSDTYLNIKDNKCFTLNLLHYKNIEKGHYTSAKADTKISEFDIVGLKEIYISKFKAPYVEESPIKVGLYMKEEIPLFNDCIMIIGEVQQIILDNGYQTLKENGLIDFDYYGLVGVDGAHTYYTLKNKESHDYVGSKDVSF